MCFYKRNVQTDMFITHLFFILLIIYVAKKADADGYHKLGSDHFLQCFTAINEIRPSFMRNMFEIPEVVNAFQKASSELGEQKSKK